MKELKSIVNNPRIKEKIKGTTNQKLHSLISVTEKYLTEEEIKSIRKKKHEENAENQSQEK